MKIQPLPLDTSTIERLRAEARTFRDDVIALRFGWDLPYLHGVALKTGIVLTTQADYLRAHPEVAARHAEAERALGRAQQRPNWHAPRPPKISVPSDERRDRNLTLCTTPTWCAAVEKEAARRGVKRGTLLTLAVEAIVKKDLWGKILP